MGGSKFSYYPNGGGGYWVFNENGQHVGMIPGGQSQFMGGGQSFQGGGDRGGRGDFYPPGSMWGEPVPPFSEPTPIPPSTGEMPPQGIGFPGPTEGSPIPRFFDPTNDLRSPGGGYFPGGGGTPAFGPTDIPTQWVNYPGVGWVPRAVPVNPGSGTPMNYPGGYSPGGFGPYFSQGTPSAIVGSSMWSGNPDWWRYF